MVYRRIPNAGIGRAGRRAPVYSRADRCDLRYASRRCVLRQRGRMDSAGGRPLAIRCEGFKIRSPNNSFVLELRPHAVGELPQGPGRGLPILAVSMNRASFATCPMVTLPAPASHHSRRTFLYGPGPDCPLAVPRTWPPRHSHPATRSTGPSRDGPAAQ